MQENGQAALVCEKKENICAREERLQVLAMEEDSMSNSRSGTSRISLEFLFCLFIRNIA